MVGSLKQNFKAVAENARLQFIKTMDKDGQLYAIIADREKLGDDGIRSFKSALRAGETPRVREGVHCLTEAQLKERLPALESREDLAASAASFKTALSSIEERKLARAVPTAPKAKAPSLGGATA